MWDDLRIYIVNNNPEKSGYDAEKQEIGHVQYWPRARRQDARYGDLGLLYYKPKRSFTRLYMCVGKITNPTEGKKIIEKYGLDEIKDEEYGGCAFKDIYKLENPISAAEYVRGNPTFGKLKDEYLTEILKNKSDPGKKELALYLRMYRFIKFWVELNRELKPSNPHIKHHRRVHKEVLQRFSLLNTNKELDEIIENILTSPTNSYETFRKIFGWPRAIPNFISKATDKEKVELVAILREMDSSPSWKDVWVDKIFNYFDKYAHTDEESSRKKRKTMLYTLLAELYGYRHIEKHPIYNSPVRSALEKVFGFKDKPFQNNYYKYEQYFNKFRDFYKAIMCYIKQDTGEKICEFINAKDESELNMEIDGLLWLTESGKETLGPKLKEAFKKIMNDEEIIEGDGEEETEEEGEEEEIECYQDTDIILNILHKEGQVILYGPVGTGKTYTAITHAKKCGDVYEFITFHQSYGYEEFIEGLKPVVDNKGHINYIVEDGIFKRLALRGILLAIKNKDGLGSDLERLLNYLKGEEDLTSEKYKDLKSKLWSYIENNKDELSTIFEDAPRVYLVIDEINRGNISRIFGELITTLEQDKRLGGENWVPITLPYSKEKFGIPPNLYIIGTMNTSDRSITLLDIALRRRFGFYELQPQYEVLENKNIEGINLAEFLKTLNLLISTLKDRDHQIGHAYLIRVNDLNDLMYVWYNKIIPLLEEFFYNDIESLEKILGPFLQRNAEAPKIIEKLGILGDSKRAYTINEIKDEKIFLEAIKQLIDTWKGGTNTGETV